MGILSYFIIATAILLYSLYLLWSTGVFSDVSKTAKQKAGTVKDKISEGGSALGKFTESLKSLVIKKSIPVASKSRYSAPRTASSMERESKYGSYDTRIPSGTTAHKSATTDNWRNSETIKNLKDKIAESRQKTIYNPHSQTGENLTTWERDFIWDSIIKRKRVRCIHCMNEDMFSGAQGGMMTNWRCPKCGQGINLGFTSNTKEGMLAENIGIDSYYIQK